MHHILFIAATTSSDKAITYTFSNTEKGYVLCVGA